MTGRRVRSGFALAVFLVLLAVGIWLLTRYLQLRGIAWAGDFGSIASAFLGAAALLTPVVSRLLGGLHGPQSLSRIDIPQARKDLAAALARQWVDEERLRRINDPRPLPVRWETAQATALTQGAPVPSGGLVGQFDDIA
jgi:hypothetical protein